MPLAELLLPEFDEEMPVPSVYGPTADEPGF